MSIVRARYQTNAIVPLFVAVFVLAGCRPLTAQNGRATLALKEIVRIDGEKEDLSALGAMAVSNRGILAVRLHQDGVIRLFQSNGSALATFGRAGAGPGEFKAVDQMVWVGDTLWVSDPSLHRLTMVGADGKVLRNQPVPSEIKSPSGNTASSGFSISGFLGMLSDGSLVLRAGRRAQGPGTGPAGTRILEEWILRTTPDGTLEGVIGQTPSDGCTVRGPSAELRLPLCQRTLSATVSGSGRVTFLATNTTGPHAKTFQLVTMGVKGDTLLSRRYALTLEPVPSRVTDSILSRFDDAPASVRDLLGVVGIPKVFPPVRSILVASDGSSWVQFAEVSKAGREWRKYDAKGTLVGTLWIREDIGVVVAEPRGLWAIVTNADGIESLVLYAVGR